MSVKPFILALASLMFVAGAAAGTKAEEVTVKDKAAVQDKARPVQAVFENKSSVKETAPPDPKEQAKALYSRGLMAMTHKEYKKAEEYLLEAIKLDPGHIDSYLYLARAYEESKQKMKALEQYKTVIGMKPEDPAGYAGAMGVYIDMGLPDNAISTAKEAVDKGIPEIYFTGDIGWAYFLKHDMNNSEIYFKKEIAKNTGDSTPHNNLGLVYFNQGKYADALACFTKASEMNPKSVVTPYFLAVTYNKLGKEDEALKALGEGVKKDPSLEARVPAYNGLFFSINDPGDLSGMFKKLKEKKT